MQTQDSPDAYTIAKDGGFVVNIPTEMWHTVTEASTTTFAFGYPTPPRELPGMFGPLDHSRRYFSTLSRLLARALCESFKNSQCPRSNTLTAFMVNPESILKVKRLALTSDTIQVHFTRFVRGDYSFLFRLHSQKLRHPRNDSPLCCVGLLSKGIRRRSRRSILG